MFFPTKFLAKVRGKSSKTKSNISKATVTRILAYNTTKYKKTKARFCGLLQTPAWKWTTKRYTYNSFRSLDAGQRRATVAFVMFDFVFQLFFRTLAKNLVGKTFLKWSIFCSMERKTRIQSVWCVSLIDMQCSVWERERQSGHWQQVYSEQHVHVPLPSTQLWRRLPTCRSPSARCSFIWKLSLIHISEPTRPY